MKVINVVMSGSGTIPELGTLDIPNANSDISNLPRIQTTITPEIKNMILNAGDKFTLKLQLSNGTVGFETFKKIDNSSVVGFTFISYLSEIKDPRSGSLSVPGVLSIVDQESETFLGFIEFV